MRAARSPIRTTAKVYGTADYQAADVIIFHCLNPHAALSSMSRLLGREPWWEPVPADMTLRPRAELAARPPCPSPLFEVHPAWGLTSAGVQPEDGFRSGRQGRQGRRQ